jgi:hypothetical protein
MDKDAASLVYLKLWETDRAQWKFRKLIQAHLLHIAYDQNKVPHARPRSLGQCPTLTSRSCALFLSFIACARVACCCCQVSREYWGMFVRYILAVKGGARQVSPTIALSSDRTSAPRRSCSRLSRLTLTALLRSRAQKILDGAKRIVAEGVRITEDEEEAKWVPIPTLSFA